MVLEAGGHPGQMWSSSSTLSPTRRVWFSAGTCWTKFHQLQINQSLLLETRMTHMTGRESLTFIKIYNTMCPKDNLNFESFECFFGHPVLCRQVSIRDANLLFGSSASNILETSAKTSQDSVDLLLASAIKVTTNMRSWYNLTNISRIIFNQTTVWWRSLLKKYLIWWFLLLYSGESSLQERGRSLTGQRCHFYQRTAYKTSRKIFVEIHSLCIIIEN